ncbi:MvdC/MvdD family ATP grasp protein [Cellulomonas septica]|uniref:ATP-grasp domain-containing protein n=1 Tax=Cellulomonas septica TaxID=285080 RepID=A0ABX1JZ48_9CELL|nr:hypothetical protein [Cellulomonas septica]NKY39196.1 hypothetical protein [Cellulomonas septica]
MIGIVSHAGDLHTQTVARHLDARGAGHRLLDTSRVPTSAALTTRQRPDGTWTGTWADADGTLDLADVGAVWWRRPQPFVLHDEVTRPHDRGFAHGECAAMVAGLWACMDAEWVNDPDRDEVASRKMRQLQLAARLGLRVPRTCMTNDPAQARDFVGSEPSGVVYKSFSATPRTWRETRPVRAEDVEMIDAVRFAPVIFQELVPGGRDVRATVVDGQVFAAEIRADRSAYEFDFRIDTMNAPISTHRLPDDVERRLVDLVATLGLRYGAADFRVAPDGEHVFLEVNPAGQWLFVELATGLPISAALADLLVRLDARAGDPRETVAPRTGAAV